MPTPMSGRVQFDLDLIFDMIRRVGDNKRMIRARLNGWTLKPMKMSFTTIFDEPSFLLCLFQDLAYDGYISE